MTWPAVAATEEARERCMQVTAALLRTHSTVSIRPADGPTRWCACGRAAVVCEVNTVLRDAGVLPALERPRSGVVTDEGGGAPRPLTDHDRDRFTGRQ